MAARASLSRRDILRYGVAGGALLATGTGGALLSAGLGAGSAVAKGGKPPTPRPHDFEEATISDLQEAMSAGHLSATELTRWYLTRIQRLNGHSPGRPTDGKLHAVIETNPDAIALAARRDAERHLGRMRGPLHGIPVIVKDNIATEDRMQTTAGSLALVGSKVPRDAPLVARLRAAGAIILGKSNLSEWANFRGIAPFNGWSARGGFTRNPYVLDLDPCGSSSGSAAAVAANLCRGCGRHRDRRFDHLPGGRAVLGRHQTDRRTRLPERHHPDRRQSRHRRTNDPHRHGRRDLAGCAAHAVRRRRGGPAAG